MSGRRDKLGIRFAKGPDPLDDPLVVGWDAVVRNAAAPAEVDPADTALLRRLHALETIPPPSPTFFDDLERHLAGLSLSVAPTVAAGPVPAEEPPHRSGFSRLTPARVRPDSSAHRPAPVRARWMPQDGRWVSMRGAVAVLSLVLVASLFVVYQAVPRSQEPPPIPAAVIAKPAIESIAQFVFAPPMWGMPDATAWTHMETGIFSVAPATSFTTDLPFYICVDGPLSLTVLSGELAVTPAGPAFFYPAHQSGQLPVEVQAGESVSIGPSETIIYSAVDTATGTNPGIEPALTMYGSMGIVDLAMGWSPPENVSLIIFEKGHPLPVPTKGATVTLQRLELAPFDTFVFEPDADLRYLPFIDPAQTEGLRISDGALEGLVPDPDAREIYGATQLRYLMPGPHTIFNLGEETVGIYFLVVEAAPDAGTPTA